MLLDISQVARTAGVPASTLRFYEQKGLIASVGRRGLRRQFDAGVMERLALIALGRAAGFTLSEIGDILRPGEDPKIDTATLLAKADEIDGVIAKLTLVRDGLRRAAACPAPQHMACPKFRRLMKLAAARAAAKH
ncbi:MAG: helix-turn-helix domain-containing protein [Pseudomonadota bacterium]